MAVAIVFLALRNAANQTEVEWDFPGADSIKVNIEKDLQDHETMLKMLFESCNTSVYFTIRPTTARTTPSAREI